MPLIFVHVSITNTNLYYFNKFVNASLYKALRVQSFPSLHVQDVHKWIHTNNPGERLLCFY